MCEFFSNPCEGKTCFSHLFSKLNQSSDEDPKTNNQKQPLTDFFFYDETQTDEETGIFFG